MPNEDNAGLYPYDGNDPAAPTDATAMPTYQDDLDTDDGRIDPVMSEENEDPAKAYNLPPQALKDEFGREEGAAGPEAADDTRENIEDWDEADGSSAADEI